MAQIHLVLAVLLAVSSPTLQAYIRGTPNSSDKLDKYNVKLRGYGRSSDDSRLYYSGENREITSVQVENEDYWAFFVGGEAKIEKGGPGYDYVRIHFESPSVHNGKFLVKIYTKEKSNNKVVSVGTPGPNDESEMFKINLGRYQNIQKSEHLSVGNDKEITAIRVTDLDNNNDNAHVQIVDGGQGYSDVRIAFQSPTGHDGKFEVVLFSRNKSRSKVIMDGHPSLDDKLDRYEVNLVGTQNEMKDSRVYFAGDDRKITGVRLTDLDENSNKGHLAIQQGGPGFYYVRVDFNSPQGHNGKFLVEVYSKGKPQSKVVVSGTPDPDDKEDSYKVSLPGVGTEIKDSRVYFAGDDRKITAIRLIDLDENNNNGKIEIQDGGPGNYFVRVNFDSPQAHNGQFLVEVYTKEKSASKVVKDGTPTGNDKSDVYQVTLPGAGTPGKVTRIFYADLYGKSIGKKISAVEIHDLDQNEDGIARIQDGGVGNYYVRVYFESPSRHNGEFSVRVYSQEKLNSRAVMTGTPDVNDKREEYDVTLPGVGNGFEDSRVYFAGDDREITAVGLTNLDENGNNGIAVIQQGGPGTYYVRVNFNSPRSHNGKFSVELYSREKSKGTVNMIGSPGVHDKLDKYDVSLPGIGQKIEDSRVYFAGDDRRITAVRLTDFDEKEHGGVVSIQDGGQGYYYVRVNFVSPAQHSGKFLVELYSEEKPTQLA